MGKLIHLKTDQDFRLFKNSRSFQNSALRIRTRFRANQNRPRFGFIVPKKIFPKAVDRNLIKRRLKAAVTEMLDRIRGADIVFYPQKPMINLNFQILKNTIKQLLIKANLWQE